MSERPTKPISTWDLFKNHRGIVTELICSEATNDGGSLCILGAGPCYGIDLGLLLSKFDRITLVDLDTATLRAGVSAQQVNNSSRLRLIGGLDLAKNQLRLEQYSRQPSREGLQRLLESSRFQEIPEIGKHDVIVSNCVISQMLGNVVECVEDRDETFIELLKAIRRSHLEVMLNALNANGTGILISDFVSSESLPELLETEDLKSVVAKAIESNNFFHGLNPHKVAGVLAETELKHRIKTLDVTAPWRLITTQRVYACFGLVFQTG